MKTAALVALALLLSAPPTVSQVADDKLIVPGQRVGASTLQATIEQMLGALGRENLIILPAQVGAYGRDHHEDIFIYAWLRVRLNAYTRDHRSILLLEADNAPEFATEKCSAPQLDETLV